MLRYQSCEGEAIAKAMRYAGSCDSPKRRDSGRYAGALPRVWDRIRFQPHKLPDYRNTETLILTYTSASLRRLRMTSHRH